MLLPITLEDDNQSYQLRPAPLFFNGKDGVGSIDRGTSLSGGIVKDLLSLDGKIVSFIFFTAQAHSSSDNNSHISLSM